MNRRVWIRRHHLATLNRRIIGHPVQPEEWFLVPLFAINEAVERLRDGSITRYVYNPATAKLVQA